MIPRSVVCALRTKTHGLRGNADQSDNRRPRSPLGNPASVDVTDARCADATIRRFGRSDRRAPPERLSSPAGGAPVSCTSGKAYRPRRSGAVPGSPGAAPGRRPLARSLRPAGPAQVAVLVVDPAHRKPADTAGHPVVRHRIVAPPGSRGTHTGRAESRR